MKILTKTKIIDKCFIRPAYFKDPMSELKRADLIRQVGNGLFVLQGPLVQLIDIIDNNIIKIAHQLGAEDVYVPSFLSWDNTNRSEYLNSFSNQALIVTSITAKKTLNKKNMGIVCPTVCYHYSSSLRTKTINKNMIITAISRCGRKEEGLLNSLERLINFTMREVVFYGTQEHVLETKEELLKASIKMFKEVFKLSFTVETASDPFFGKVADLKKMAQILSESKYELKADLPFKKGNLSVASFNNHGSVFYKRFGIKSKNKLLSFSGCVGWGYERILYAILSQKGTNFKSNYYKKLISTK